MHQLYLFSVWLHIVAAALWLGGMFFLVLVIVPWLRKNPEWNRATLLRETGLRFRTVGWICFALLFATGIFNLWMRGVRLEDFGEERFWLSAFGHLVVLKLGLFAVVVALSLFHDFFLGPRAIDEMKREPHGASAQQLRKLASYLGRTNALLALLLVGLGVMIVRGAAF